MNLRAVCAAAALALSAVAAHAETEITVGVHLYTYHFDPSQGYNNVNPGAYVRLNEWVIGTYYNSERNPSVYGGYTLEGIFGTPIDVTVGAVTGYQRASVMPLIIPSVKVFDTGVRLSLLLPPEKSGWALHISYEF